MLINSKRIWRATLVLPFLAMLCLIGCGVSPYQYGKRALEIGDYQGAITALQEAVRAEPANSHTWREFGIAYYQLREYAEAKPHLERACRMNPMDAKAALYLALTCEHQAQYKQAVATYDYLAQIARSISLSLRGLVAVYSLKLKERWHQHLVSNMLARETEITAKDTSEQTIALMPIVSLDEGEGMAELAGTLTYFVGEALSSSIGWEMMEVLLVRRLISELGLGGTDAIDVILGERIGKLLGAEVVITGTLKKIETDRFRFDLTLMRTGSGAIHEFDGIVGTPADLAQFVRSLDDWIVSISAPRSEEQASRMPMENSEALLDFARGRKFFDAGQYGKAAQSFRRSINRYPDFLPTTLFLNRAEALMDERFKTVTVQELEDSFIRAEMATISRQALLYLIDARLGDGFITVEEPQQVRSNGNQKFPGTDLPLTIQVQWE